MRGKVLSFNDTSGRGLISGEDGQRYTFMRAGLEGGLRTVRRARFRRGAGRFRFH